MKKIAFALIGLTALLTACPQPPTPTPQGMTVTGTVVEDATPAGSLELVTQPWTGGAGKVNLVTPNADLSALVNLAQGNLNTNGTFSITAPATVDASLLVKASDEYVPAPNCTGTVTASDPSAMTTAALMTVDATKDGEITPMLIDFQQDQAQGKTSLTYKFGGLQYTDRNVTLTGTQTCTETGAEGVTQITRVNANTTLTKGWNLTTITLTMSYDAAKPNEMNTAVTLTSGALPTDKWMFSPETAANTKLPGTSLSVQGLSSLKSLKAMNVPFLR